MNIGDRVRLMHGREEGIITRFIGTDQVEIAIDGDFTIPVMRREVVVIAAEEAKFLGNEPAEQTQAQKSQQLFTNPVSPVLSGSGIYVALVHQSPELLAVNVVNNTDYDLLFTYGEERDAKYKGILNDKLNARSSKAVSHMHLKDFDKWPDVIMQFLLHRAGTTSLLQPELKRLKFKASSFYKSKNVVPVLKKEGYLFQVDNKPAEVNTGKILQHLSENPEPVADNYKLKTPASEIDLHIEKLTDEDVTLMSNSEILRRQLAVFQDNLDRALAANLPEITFIHGTGNGVLKKEIQKILSRNKEIKYFEDAKKEKFGYGATKVKLK
ncbi:Smr/MutS family protein [Adhaeribacter terreus]|uniref:Smr/MutS family protein n=1 Tax=Adhaeribacter terreus TaxID=529703 RepID=A0ABW0EF35_9BACT